MSARDGGPAFADWEGFGRAMLNGWPESACEAMDGGDVQDLGVRFGVLVGEERHEPCGERCNCAEYYDDDRPWICYRIVARNAAESAQEPAGGEGEA